MQSCWSHPTMGAWIEIMRICKSPHALPCRTPRWVRGLKFIFEKVNKVDDGVAPHDGCVD